MGWAVLSLAAYLISGQLRIRPSDVMAWQIACIDSRCRKSRNWISARELLPAEVPALDLHGATAGR
jgi:hypothetical protein